MMVSFVVSIEPQSNRRSLVTLSSESTHEIFARAIVLDSDIAGIVEMVVRALTGR